MEGPNYNASLPGTLQVMSSERRAMVAKLLEGMTASDFEFTSTQLQTSLAGNNSGQPVDIPVPDSRAISSSALGECHDQTAATGACEQVRGPFEHS